MLMQGFVYHAGSMRKIGFLLREDRSIRLEAHGSASEGFAAFLVWRDGTALRVSDVYSALRDLKDAAWRIHQVEVTAKRNSFHGVL